MTSLAVSRQSFAAHRCRQDAHPSARDERWRRESRSSSWNPPWESAPSSNSICSSDAFVL
eukprot:7433739-Pyramimonas_sp.AAC.1